MDERHRRQRVAERIGAALAERFGPELERLSPDTPLAEAGLDSVDMLDALAELERVFAVSFEREEFVGVVTLEDLYTLVCERLVEERGEGCEP